MFLYSIFADFYHSAANSLEGSCSTFLVIASVLGCLLFLSAFIMCYLVSRLHSALASPHRTRSIDQLVRDHKRKYSVGPGEIAVVDTSGYTGRNTVQWCYGNSVRPWFKWNGNNFVTNQTPTGHENHLQFGKHQCFRTDDAVYNACLIL